MDYSRRHVLRLLGGVATLPVVGAALRPATVRAEVPSNPAPVTVTVSGPLATRVREAWVRVDGDTGWLHVPEVVVAYPADEDLGLETLPDGTVVRRRRRSLP